MEVPKLPLPDLRLGRPEAAAAPGVAPRPPLAPPGTPDEVSVAGAVAALVDQVHIHPLDLTGAMQIMMAEVRADLALPGDVPLPGAGPHGGGVHLEPLLLATGGMPEELGVATAPQTLVQQFLHALPPPETLEPAAWLAAATQVEVALQGALDRAVAAVAVWRDVPMAVVDAANQTREVVVAAITDDTPNALWLRPEWLGLAPRMERYWRRRRRARQRLSDPDLHWRERDQDREPDPPR